MNQVKYFTGILLLIITASFLSSGFAEDPKGWHLKRDRQGIQVYARNVEGSPVMEVKTVTTVKTSLENVIAFFEKMDMLPNWMSKCKEYRELQEKSPTEKIFYLQHNLPWPLSNRDVVLDRSETKAPETKAVTYVFTQSQFPYPLQKNVVRMPYTQSLWRFTPREDGTVELYFQLHLDLGGNIPKWLVNEASIELPYNSMKRFKGFLLNPHYPPAKREFQRRNFFKFLPSKDYH